MLLVLVYRCTVRGSLWSEVRTERAITCCAESVPRVHGEEVWVAVAVAGRSRAGRRSRAWLGTASRGWWRRATPSGGCGAPARSRHKTTMTTNIPTICTFLLYLFSPASSLPKAFLFLFFLSFSVFIILYWFSSSYTLYHLFLPNIYLYLRVFSYFILCLLSLAALYPLYISSSGVTPPPRAPRAALPQR